MPAGSVVGRSLGRSWTWSVDSDWTGTAVVKPTNPKKESGTLVIPEGFHTGRSPRPCVLAVALLHYNTSLVNAHTAGFSWETGEELCEMFTRSGRLTWTRRPGLQRAPSAMGW